MSDQTSTIVTGSTIRVAVATQSAIAIPLVLTWIDVTTRMPMSIFACGIATWVLLVLVLTMFKCTAHIVQKQADREAQFAERLEEMQGTINELQKLLAADSREARIAAMTAALNEDDNVTSINRR